MEENIDDERFVWLPQFSYIPISLVVPPSLYLVHHQMNLLYQFWLHTEVIDKVGPLEWVLNTPSHHRVHHGQLTHDSSSGHHWFHWFIDNWTNNRKQQVLPGQEFWRLANHLGPHVRYVSRRAARCTHRLRTGWSSQIVQSIIRPGLTDLQCKNNYYSSVFTLSLSLSLVSKRSITIKKCTRNGNRWMDGRTNSTRWLKDPVGDQEVHGLGSWKKYPM